MDTNAILSLIDWTLTPQNASERGYEFVDDVLYDSHTSIIALQDILRLVKEDGFKFGEPHTKEDPDLVFGLYAPNKVKKGEYVKN